MRREDRTLAAQESPPLRKVGLNHGRRSPSYGGPCAPPRWPSRSARPRSRWRRAPGAATLFTDDFNDGNSTGWTTSGGTWSGDRAPSSARPAPAPMPGPGPARPPGPTTRSTARIRPTAFNGSNRFVALLARATSNTSYYYLALRSSNVVELKKLVGGSSTTLATAPLTVSVGHTYTVSLTVDGSSCGPGQRRHAAGRHRHPVRRRPDRAWPPSTPAPPSTTSRSTVGPPGPTPSPTDPPPPPPTTPPPIDPARTTTPPPVPPAGSADGFASVNALGLNGTTGGVGGPDGRRRTTTSRLADLHRHRRPADHPGPGHDPDHEQAGRPS